MPFCRECGKAVEEDWVTCPYCSQAIGPPASAMHVQDSIVSGDVNIVQNVGDTGKPCQSCGAQNVRIMSCSDCINQFCEICEPDCKVETLTEEIDCFNQDLDSSTSSFNLVEVERLSLNRFDSSIGAAPLCKACISQMEKMIEEKNQSKILHRIALVKHLLTDASNLLYDKIRGIARTIEKYGITNQTEFLTMVEWVAYVENYDIKFGVVPCHEIFELLAERGNGEIGWGLIPIIPEDLFQIILHKMKRNRWTVRNFFPSDGKMLAWKNGQRGTELFLELCNFVVETPTKLVVIDNRDPTLPVVPTLFSSNRFKELRELYSLHDGEWYLREEGELDIDAIFQQELHKLRKQELDKL